MTTDAAGIASINFNVASGLAIGTWMTVTATNQSNGDTSGFSNAVSAQPVSVAFAAASFDRPIDRLDGDDRRPALRQPGRRSLGQLTRRRTARPSPARITPPSRASLTFAPNQTDATFSIPILANSNRPTTFSTVNLVLSQPGGGATLGSIAFATLTITNNTTTKALTFVVTNTGDSGPGTLRDAIIAANNDPNPGVDNIVFEIPASTAANQNVPVPGFDPITQTWKISLASALPVITHPVTIDGYTQANIAVPYRYPNQVTSAVQDLIDRRRPDRRNVHPDDARAAAGRHDAADPLLGDTRADPAGPGRFWDDHSGLDNVSVTEPTPGVLAITFQGD